MTKLSLWGTKISMTISKSKTATIELLDQYFNTAFSAPEGIPKLRELILSLAMQGQLVPQNPDDKPARELLKDIEAEKQRLIKEGKLKKSDPLPEITPDEIPYDIPDTWEWVRLGDIVSILGDGLHGTPIYNETGEYFFINGNNLSDGFIEIKQQTKRVSFDEYLKHKKVLNNNTVFVSINGTIGNVAFYRNEKIILGKSVCYFNLLLDINKFYLKKFINSHYFFNHVLKLATGTTIKNVSLKIMRELPIPLPPLEEQRRIVERIESLMEKCDRLQNFHQQREATRLKMQLAVGHKLLNAPDKKTFNEAWQFMADNFETLYSVKENVKELRKIILQLAVMGKLVPQDTRDRSARELLKDIETEKERLIKEGKIKKQKPLPAITPDEIPYDIPDTWQWIKLDHICSYIQRGKSPKYVEKSDFPVIAQKCIQWHGLELFKAKFICPQSIETYSEERFLKTGDLLWNSTGLGTLGRALIYVHENNIYKQVVADSHVTVIRPIFVKSKFLYFWIASPFVQDLIVSKSSGSTKQIELATSTIKNHIFPLPPLEEQKRIVEKVDKMMKLCDELEKKITAQTDTQTRLLHSTIAQIFP
ncbi:restriction endonuclease subunit S [Geminocystis herdmanii]|uniref:restriction endonuclease subunit S n=1 Tax=Geminocystis herdmanii TaxID=669359 RepID=UPI0003463A9B|nr:restriction endonuclease subunit S [Geminocystis herdmanii]